MITTDHRALRARSPTTLPAADLSRRPWNDADPDRHRDQQPWHADQAPGRKLIVPPPAAFEAERIVATPSATANNDINAMQYGHAARWRVRVELSHGHRAFFIRTDCPDGLNHFQRRALEFKKDNDFAPRTRRRSPRALFGGWSDWRSVYEAPASILSTLTTTAVLRGGLFLS